MRSVNAVHVILLKEPQANIFAENVAGSTGRDAEALGVTLGIAPHQICKRSFVRNFLHALNLLDVIDLLNGRR